MLPHSGRTPESHRYLRSRWPCVGGLHHVATFAWIATAAVLAAVPAAAQDAAGNYPNKPVKVVVTVPAGGGVDTATRIFAERLQQRLGQPFVIENRGGAGGNVAAETVSCSPPTATR